MPQSLLPWVRKVVVGSTNPVKIAAVHAVMARVAPDATVHAVGVASGVPDQPWGDEETQRGANERARQALLQEEFADADLSFGVEGGVVLQSDGSVRTCAWAVARTRDQQSERPSTQEEWAVAASIAATSSSDGRYTNIGCLTPCKTLSATLPSNMRTNPERLWVASAMMPGSDSRT